MLRRALLIIPLSLLLGAGAMLLLPQLAFAHEVEAMQIGNTPYVMMIGPMNEPVVVDDKSGLELMIKQADPADPHNFDAPGAQPVTGLDKTLKVELGANGKQMTMGFMPGDRPGTYDAMFFPTVQTVYTYRIFGTIGNTPVDFTTGCHPDPSQAKPDNNTAETLSPGVTRTYDSGFFSCPVSKVDLGFPEMSASVQQLMQASNMDMTDHTSRDLSYVAIVVGGIGMGVGVAGLRRKRQF